MSALPLDLVLLVADLDQEQTMRALLEDRTPSLGIRKLTVEYLRHPRKDPGCFNQGPDLLVQYQNRAEHALILLDREGCGHEELTSEQIEADISARLETSGWGTRGGAVAIDPELEIWVWSDSPQVDNALGWTGRSPSLRDWLRARQLLAMNEAKPQNPKEAFRLALREVSQKPSASVFARLARQVGLDRCTDVTFARLHARLQVWFGKVS